MKKTSLCFFDFDNTLYRGKHRYLILDFPEFLAARKLFDEKELSGLEDLTRLYINQSIGRDEFAVRVIESYYKGLTGQSTDEINQQAHMFWRKRDHDFWFSYTIPLVNFMKNYTTTVLVSGSPMEILSFVYRDIGIKVLYGTRGIIEKGIYTGAFHLHDEMATYHAKEKLMTELSAGYQFNPHTSFAFGDSESDIPLLRSVDPANAFMIGEGKEIALLAQENKWTVFRHDDDILRLISPLLREKFSNSP
jgi:HAD superfamily phosphoserine phosphatase-like hydrolase